MLAKIISCATVGLEGALIEVEVDISAGLPSLTIVGLPDAAVNESKERVRAAVPIVVLCGAATAGAGPIVFVGLVIPHVARMICGPDYRWILAWSAVLAPTLLLATDTLGRLIAHPGEVQVGVMTAVVGAPVFIALVRRRELTSL